MTSLDIIIPVYNEEFALPICIDKLSRFLSSDMPAYDWHIIIADNGSTDSTYELANSLVSSGERIFVDHLEQKGRGRALYKTWSASNADIICYMDVDLSTCLTALPSLIKSVQSGYDIAIGCRLMKSSKVEKRTLKRELISRCYNTLIKIMFWTRFSDAQCGFKAISQRIAKEVVPLVRDKGWFFDSELLIIADKNKYRIKDIPVHWVDDPDTRVKIAGTAWADFKGLLRLRLGGIPKVNKV